MSDGGLQARGKSVWDEFYGFVYQNLRAQGFSHFDSEDLTQDILETACVHLEEIEPGARRTWLMKVTRNKIVDRARNSRHLHSVSELTESADPSLGPDEIALRSADRRMLLEAIAHLSERDRRLVETRYLEERSVLETAHEMGMSVGATKVALHRARERLREALERAEALAKGHTRKREPMLGIAERGVLALTPYIGKVAADTCVRGTAISIGKSFDTLTMDDYDALAHRVRRVLAPLLPVATVERLLEEVRGGTL